MIRRRVVITGVGAISPLGMTAEELWDGLCEGRCGIDTIKAFDPSGFTCRIAGEVGDFKVNKQVPKSYRKAIKLMSRDIKLSIMASNEAIADSGFVTKATDAENTTLEPARTAINFGAGLISCDLVELAPAVAESITDGKFDIHKWGEHGLDALTPIWLLKYLPNMLACHVGIIHDIQGPSNSITCGEAGGLIAIAEASQVIQRNVADAALAGGCESKVNPIVMLRQCLLKRATETGNDNPDTACRPFDKDASGSVYGEGAGVMVLEELEHAKKRNANIYAELVGSASSSSINPAYEHTDPDGTAIRISIENAIAEAGITPDEIDLIIPHGTGIAEDDLAEAKAIQEVFGDAIENITVWPTKSMLSNTGAGAGVLDTIAAAKAIKLGKMGPAKNFESPAPGIKLNISKQAQKKTVRYALCCAYTFGGQAAALVLKNINDKI